MEIMLYACIPFVPPISVYDIVSIERQRLIKNWNEQDLVIPGVSALSSLHHPYYSERLGSCFEGKGSL